MAEKVAAVPVTVPSAAVSAPGTVVPPQAAPAATTTPPAQQKLSESDDFTDNSAENTKEANQEDTSQQSGLATVESEYDTASDSPSDGGEEEDEEEDYEEEESGGEEEDDEEDDDGTDDDDDGTEEEDDEDDVIEVLERQSGDGQEQDADSRRKVDDDEDRSNPQYIPKKGTFYEHDDRTAEDDLDDSGQDGDGDQRSKRNEDGLGDGLGDSHGGGGGGGPGSGGGGGGGGLGAPGLYGGERRGSEKGGSGAGAKGTKKWQASTDRWTHDRFDESEQAPKSQAELVFAYGYDIRSEDGPPKARRKRRYARGPNRYTRNWEDEDAYQKSSNAEHHQRHKKVPRPEEFPELAGANGKSGGRATGRGRNGSKSGSSGTAGPDQRRQSGATDGGRTKSSDVRRSAGQDRSMGRSERVRSGDWSSGAGGGDREREQDRGADWDRSEYGGSLRYRNEDRGSRNNYHNKENKLSGARNSKEKDYKVINSLQFKNQARNKSMEGGIGGNGGAPVTGPTPGSAAGAGLSDGNPGGAPMMHSNSAGALSGSSNSNKMNNHVPVQQHNSGSSNGNAGGISNDRIQHSESNQQPGRMISVVNTSASLGSVPVTGSQQHYGHHTSSLGQIQQQHSHQQQQQQQQQPTQKLKQGYMEEDHSSKYAVPLYAGSSTMDRMQPNVVAGGGPVPVGNLPMNQRSQISPRAIVAQTPPSASSEQVASERMAVQMEYQPMQGSAVPQGYGGQQRSLPVQQQQQQQQQQVSNQLQHQQQSMLQTEVPRNTKRYSTQRQRSALENAANASALQVQQQQQQQQHQQQQQQAAAAAAAAASMHEQQQMLQHQQLLRHQHEQLAQQSKQKQVYSQQQLPQPGPAPGGLPMTLQAADYHGAVSKSHQQPPPPAPGGQNPAQVQYHQAAALYYTPAGAAGGPSPGDYVTAAASGGQPQQQPPQQPTQAPPPPQAQYAPPPYATQGPPPPPPQTASYMQGPVPAPSAYLSAPQPANVTTVPQPPAGVPGGAPPPPMNFVPALGPPPTASAPPGVTPGQYPGPAAYATSFQTGYAPTVGVVPQAVPGGPPPPSVVTGPPTGGPGGPPPTALYQPSGGITYYAPQTQTQTPRPLPTGRRPTAAIPILAPPERKPAVSSTTTPSSQAANKTSSTRTGPAAAGDTNETAVVDVNTGVASSVDTTTPSGATTTIDSGENIDHILDNMFVQRPQYQPPSRKSPSPALAPSVATQQPLQQSQPTGNDAANGAAELRGDGSITGVDGQDSMDNIGESVKKMSIQDTDKLSLTGSLAVVENKEVTAGGGVIETNTSSQPVE